MKRILSILLILFIVFPVVPSKKVYANNSNTPYQLALEQYSLLNDTEQQILTKGIITAMTYYGSQIEKIPQNVHSLATQTNILLSKAPQYLERVLALGTDTLAFVMSACGLAIDKIIPDSEKAEIIRKDAEGFNSTKLNKYGLGWLIGSSLEEKKYVNIGFTKDPRFGTLGTIRSTGWKVRSRMINGKRFYAKVKAPMEDPILNGGWSLEIKTTYLPSAPYYGGKNYPSLLIEHWYRFPHTSAYVYASLVITHEPELSSQGLVSAWDLQYHLKNCGDSAVEVLSIKNTHMSNAWDTMSFLQNADGTHVDFAPFQANYEKYIGERKWPLYDLANYFDMSKMVDGIWDFSKLLEGTTLLLNVNLYFYKCFS